MTSQFATGVCAPSGDAEQLKPSALSSPFCATHPCTPVNPSNELCLSWVFGMYSWVTNVPCWSPKVKELQHVAEPSCIGCSFCTLGSQLYRKWKWHPPCARCGICSQNMFARSLKSPWLLRTYASRESRDYFSFETAASLCLSAPLCLSLPLSSKSKSTIVLFWRAFEWFCSKRVSILKNQLHRLDPSLQYQMKKHQTFCFAHVHCSRSRLRAILQSNLHTRKRGEPWLMMYCMFTWDITCYNIVWLHYGWEYVQYVARRTDFHGPSTMEKLIPILMSRVYLLGDPVLVSWSWTQTNSVSIV